MISLNNSDRWQNIQENVDKIDYLIRDLSKRGFATAHELGHLSFLSALVTDQAEKILLQNKHEK